VRLERMEGRILYRLLTLAFDCSKESTRCVSAGSTASCFRKRLVLVVVLILILKLSRAWAVFMSMNNQQNV
jgi:hypothetical protein